MYFWLISGNLPDLTKNVVEQLVQGQKFLYEIYKAVQIGYCRPEQENRKPGKISNSSWLTFPNRIFRVYVSTLNPSENLQLLVNYVFKVYATIWFLIKQKPSFKGEAKHIFRLIMCSSFYPKISNQLWVLLSKAMHFCSLAKSTYKFCPLITENIFGS